MTKQAAHKPSLFSTLLAPLTGHDQLVQEKARLEAFLNAFPGEYCGFHEDGSVAYSEGFCALIGLSGVQKIEDVQAALETGDSAALEGQFLSLESEGKGFSIKVRLERKNRVLRLRGAAGAALGGGDKFRILWAEDITDEDDTLLGLKQGRETARQQADLLRAALDHNPAPVWMRDGTGDLSWVNKAYASMLNTEPAPALDAQVEIAISQKGQGRSPKEMARDALADGKAQTSKTHIIAHGKRRWVELSEIPLAGSGGTVGLLRDLTREEEIQSDLDRHKAANKSLLEQLRTAIAIFGADQGLEFFNTAYATQWGLEEGWLNNRPKLGDILEKLREARRLPEQADFRKYKQGWLDWFTRLIDPHEDMLYLPDGAAVRMLVMPHPMGGLMMTFEDVTSRLELESNYNTLIAVQKETLDNLGEGVVVYGGDGRLKLWNPSFARLWDLNPEELEGGPHINKIVDRTAAFFVPDDWANIRKSLVAHGLEREARDGQLIRTDGMYVYYATMPLPDGGVMVSYYDITDTQRVENALRDKNAALEAAEQLKTDFLANVSYQLRTPLNAIMGFAEILGNQYFGPLNDRQTEYTTGIHESGERLISLIDDILDLATIEAGYLELKKEKVDIAELLTGISDLTTEWARKNELQVILSCPDNIGIISADERRLKQVMLNLIRNAINFTPAGGKINITAKKSGDSVEIAIADTGVGIPADDMKRIFQPFERIPTGRNDAGNAGAGLGLSLVKNIIELHGGKILIDSIEGQGTTATIRL